MNETMLKMQNKTSKEPRKRQVLFGVSCRVYEGLEKDSLVNKKTIPERKSQSLCERIPEKRENKEKELRGMWKSRFPNTPSKLFKTNMYCVAVSKVSHETS